MAVHIREVAVSRVVAAPSDGIVLSQTDDWSHSHEGHNGRGRNSTKHLAHHAEDKLSATNC